MKGLLGRRSLPNGQGILLKPASSVHMAFMRFAIDAVFLDRDMRVVKIAADLKPWRAAGARGSKSVLEIAAGEAAQRGLSGGDRLAVGSSPAATATPSRPYARGAPGPPAGCAPPGASGAGAPRR